MRYTRDMGPYFKILVMLLNKKQPKPNMGFRGGIKIMKRMVDANIFTKANGDVVINDGMEVNTNGDVTVGKDLHVKGKITGGVQSTPLYTDAVPGGVTFDTVTADNELYFKRFGNVVTCFYGGDISAQSTAASIKIVGFTGAGLENFLPDQGEKYFVCTDEAGTPAYIKIDNTGITLDIMTNLSGDTVYACWTYIKEE